MATSYLEVSSIKKNENPWSIGCYSDSFFFFFCRIHYFFYILCTLYLIYSYIENFEFSAFISNSGLLDCRLYLCLYKNFPSKNKKCSPTEMMNLSSLSNMSQWIILDCTITAADGKVSNPWAEPQQPFDIH